MQNQRKEYNDKTSGFFKDIEELYDFGEKNFAIFKFKTEAFDITNNRVSEGWESIT